MTRTTFHIILLCVFLVFLSVTGWIVHWNIQFRKDLFLSTFIEVENDKELLKKFEDVERFAEDFRKELQKANEQTNGKFSAIAKRVQNAPDESVPRIFVTFLRDKLDISPNTHYESENGQLYYYLEKGSAKVKLKLRNHLLRYKIAEVENLAKILNNEERYGEVVKDMKSKPDPQVDESRATPPMVRQDSFMAAVQRQISRANKQANDEWLDFEQELKDTPKDSALWALKGFVLSLTKRSNIRSNYRPNTKDTALFVVSEIFPEQDDTIELHIQMIANNKNNFSLHKPLNLDTFLVKHHQLAR